MESPVQEQLKHNYEQLKRVNEKVEKRSNNLEARAVQVAAYYIIFQAIILVAISQPSTNLSNRQWIPFGLSFSVSIVFGLTFTNTIKEWERSRYHFDLNWLEIESMYSHMSSSSTTASHGCNYCLNQTEERQKGAGQVMMLSVDKVVVYQRYAYMYTMLAALLAFTVLIFYACFKLL